MKKIMVVGVSAGAGKSTFARELGKRLQMPVYHLDAYYWKAGWTESDPEEFSQAVAALAAQSEWIIEGNYSSTFETRMAEADTMIYLELPLRVCLYRVLKRWMMNIGRTREDMAPGCPEKIDREFISFIIRTYKARKASMRVRLHRFESMRPGNQAILLTDRQKIRKFLDAQGKEKKHDSTI